MKSSSDHDHAMSSKFLPKVLSYFWGPQATTRHRLSMVFLIVFFTMQTWAAASYYWGDYVWDERFAWRMFSTVRNLKCDFQMWRVSEQSGALCPDGSSSRCEQVRLSSEQHMVWVNLMRRGRLSVLDQWAVHECDQQSEEKGVFVKLRCQAPDGQRTWTPVQSPKVNLCRSPRRRQPLSSLRHSLETH